MNFSVLEPSGKNFEWLKEFADAIEKQLFDLFPEEKINGMRINQADTKNIQRNCYSGGCVRRMRDGIIFNNDPYNWEGVDFSEFEISSDFKDSRRARESDLILLLKSQISYVHNKGIKMQNRYENIQTKVQTEILDQTPQNLDMKDKIDLLTPQQKIIANLSDSDFGESGSLISCQKFQKEKVATDLHLVFASSLIITARTESTKDFEANLRKNPYYQPQILLLENFLPDSDECIYYPKERFLNKLLQSFINENLKKEFQDVISQMRIVHNKIHHNKKILDSEKMNTVVGSVFLELINGQSRIIPIEQDKDQQDEIIIKNKVILNYQNLYLEANKKLTDFVKIDIFQPLQEVIKIIDENPQEFLYAWDNVASKLKKEIENFKTYMEKEWTLYKFEQYDIDQWNPDWNSHHNFKEICKKHKLLQPIFEKLELLTDKRKQANEAHMNFNKTFLKGDGIDETKLMGTIRLIRGHSESQLLDRLWILPQYSFEPQNVKRGFVLLVSTNEVCSACSNVIPEIRRKAAIKLNIDAAKIILIYIPCSPHIEGKLYIKLNANMENYKKKSSSAIKKENVVCDAEISKKSFSFHSYSCHSSQIMNQLKNCEGFFSKSISEKSMEVKHASIDKDLEKDEKKEIKSTKK